MKVSRITSTQPRLNWLRRDKYEDFVASIIEPRITEEDTISVKGITEIKSKLDGFANGETTAKGYNVHIGTFLSTVARLYGSELVDVISSKASRTLSEDDF